METIIRVRGMYCRSCEILLNEVISEIPGIKNAKTSIADGIVRIDHQTPDVVEKAKEVIQKEGYVVMT